jgi:hypothetical protein
MEVLCVDILGIFAEKLLQRGCNIHIVLNESSVISGITQYFT